MDFKSARGKLMWCNFIGKW